jgi:Ca-activated chloride channel family protein
MYALVGSEATGPRSDDLGTESYSRIHENPFVVTRETPVSTFSIDVDTASYANVRRFVHDGRLPPADAVRVEELLNYFHYGYAPPAGDEPVAVTTEVGPCPWNPQHRLAVLGLRARALPEGRAPRRNLTFLIDVSGSMDDPRKLPLLERGLALLVDQLEERDRVAIVVYAGASGVVLPPTSGADKERIRDALASLEAGGSTNGGAGIELAYHLAEQSFVPGGVNRVILATDGDFNVGVTSDEALVRLIEEKRRTGIALTVLGFGMGNLKDSTMEKLADKGDGNYAYVDSLAEARKVLVEEAAGTLVTVARDVKIQVQMNPAEVASYRLLGYEDRLLRREEFDDDAADAGELGAGQTVTALYEIEPAPGATGGELGALRIRWKAPGRPDSRLRAWPIRDGGRALAATSPDFRFAAAVAAFGMSLRQSPHRGQATLGLAGELARGAIAAASDEHRREFVALVDAARRLGADKR